MGERVRKWARILGLFTGLGFSQIWVNKTHYTWHKDSESVILLNFFFNIVFNFFVLFCCEKIDYWCLGFSISGIIGAKFDECNRFVGLLAFHMKSILQKQNYCHFTLISFCCW